MKKFIIPSMAAALALAITGCGGSGPSVTLPPSGAAAPSEAPLATASPGSEVPLASEAPASEAPAAGATVGTMENPAPIGSTARIGDWFVRVNKVTKNANKIVANENQFNDKPKSGQQFVMWNVTAMYAGDETGTPSTDLSWKLLGSDGNTFSDYCGVIPDSLSDVGETFPKGKVKGNVCVPADTTQLNGAKIILEPYFSMDDTRTFFALG